MPESDEERRAREEKDRIYAVQRDAALASVRGGRAARSFVEARGTPRDRPPGAPGA